MKNITHERFEAFKAFINECEISYDRRSPMNWPQAIALEVGESYKCHYNDVYYDFAEEYIEGFWLLKCRKIKTPRGRVYPTEWVLCSNNGIVENSGYRCPTITSKIRTPKVQAKMVENMKTIRERAALMGLGF